MSSTYYRYLYFMSQTTKHWPNFMHAYGNFHFNYSNSYWKYFWKFYSYLWTKSDLVAEVLIILIFWNKVDDDGMKLKDLIDTLNIYVSFNAHIILCTFLFIYDYIDFMTKYDNKNNFFAIPMSRGSWR